MKRLWWAAAAATAIAAAPGCGGGSAPDAGGGGGADGGTGGGTDAAPLVDPSEELYAPDALPSFDIILPPESIDALWAAPDVYARGALVYGDETVSDIGVRLKGEWNFRDLSGKAAFKLKFDEFVPDQRFRGLKHMTFNNSLEDPSFVAERLVYEAFRAADLPAPRCNNANVSVNGELYGLYVNVETEDKTLLSRWFDSNDGNLYEELGYDWFPGNEYDFDLETNELADDRSDLTALFAAVEAAGDDTLLADVAPVLDTDRFLHYCALEGMVNQWDGYAYTFFGPNNYRLYHDPTTGWFTILPWGMDMSMKPYGGQEFMDLWATQGWLLTRCAASATCRPAYESVLAAEADRWEALQLDVDAMAIYGIIRDSVYADPRNEHPTGEFESTFLAVMDHIAGVPASVRAQLP